MKRAQQKIPKLQVLVALRRKHSQKVLKNGVQAWAVALGVRARQNFS